MTTSIPQRAAPQTGYYRLADASWLMIRQEYLNGATAKAIQKKWGVPPSTLYRHAYTEGWSKKSRAVAFHDQVVARAQQAEAAGEAFAGPSAGHHGPRRAAPLFENLDLPRMWREEEWRRRDDERLYRDDAAQPDYRQGPIPGYAPRAPRDRVRPDPPAPPPSPDAEAPDLPPAEAAERLAAAAGRAALAGRYDDAQKLARLAGSLRRIGGPAPRSHKAGAGRIGRGAARSAEGDDDEENEDLPFDDRPLDCTPRTCAVWAIYQRAEAALDRIYDRLDPPERADLIDWLAMAEAVDARIDPEVRDIAVAFAAEGVAAVRTQVLTLVGRPPTSVSNGAYAG